MSTVNNSEYIHKIYNNDPILLKSYVNKRIEVTTQDCTIHRGILYTIDPVSESVVLIERDNDKFHAKVIVGHSIKNIEVTSSDSEFILPQFFTVSQEQLTETDLAIKKAKIKKLFEDNRFPVTENNDILEIKGMLFIEPPYDLENCICTNPIILRRIQNIFSQVTIK